MLKRKDYFLWITPALALLFTACGPSDDAERIATLSGDPNNGRSIYAANCTACHGVDGKGGSVNTDLVEYASERDDAEIVQVILRGNLQMPSYEDTLTDQEIADVTAYVNTL